MTEKLMPCPFCGSSDIDANGWMSETSTGPACDDCGASAGQVSNDHAANVTAWNTRQPTPAADVVETVARAADILDQYAAFILTVKADDLEVHPYQPAVEEAASDLRAAIAAMQARSAGPASDPCKLPVSREIAEWNAARDAGLSQDAAIARVRDLPAERAEALEENRAWSEVVTTIMARCEALEDEASDGLGRSVNEHAQGYWRGQKTTAKSLRRELHDLTRALRSDEREG
ncbi:Lar family restriction alleviation protein [Novosphingobium sp. BL-8H]|uniref:Lar family restriction alleviation protein n=1 Tax=Novosphingobium sp. BL-8H TaxID=3127640 RepID=UPI0037583F2B